MAIIERGMPLPASVVDPTLFDDSSIKPGVLAEINELADLGLDVKVTSTPDIYRPDPERQLFIDATVAELEASATGAEDFRNYAGIADWGPLTKRAIALHTLYNPDGETLGQGIDPTVYDRPMFASKSANTLLREDPKLSPEKAERWVRAYQDFVPARIDDGTATAVGSRDFFKGTADARAVRTRATAAMELAAEHISASPLLADRQDLVSASLACGAAGPVYNLVKGLGERGHEFSEVILIDQDPMALATAASLAEDAGLADKARIEKRDLLDEKITDFIAPNSVDVADLLGLFEYLPNDEKFGRWGSGLLANVRKIVKPGGMIIFGNMLNERPQQGFFNNVVKWPRLQQRPIREVLDIIQEAGFDASDVSVRVPSEGVYAVYAIRVPELEPAAVSSEPVTKMLGKSALAPY